MHLKKIEKVMIYSKTKCSYCKMAKARFQEFGIDYEETVLDDDDTRKEFYQKCSDETSKEIQSVPQIYINEKHIGGWSDLKKVLTFDFDHNKKFLCHKIHSQYLILNILKLEAM